MAVPTPHDWTAGEVATSANMQSLTDTLAFLLDPPRCRVQDNAGISAANATYTLIALNGEVYDTVGMHSNVTNNSRVTVVESGLYLINVSLRWNSNATGYREIMLRQNAAGSDVSGTSLGIWGVAAANGANTNVYATRTIFLSAGDYVEVFGRQSSGGALSTISGSSYVEAVWIANSAT